jgi:hypothetical protein
MGLIKNSRFPARRLLAGLAVLADALRNWCDRTS